MGYLVWQSDLDTGIDVIDHQHRRLITIINALADARAQENHQAMTAVLDELIDYAHSHFTFEEALMEDAGYAIDRVHKQLHDAFMEGVRQYRVRFQAGEDVADDLKAMLSGWLFQHIRTDDQAYVATVKRSMLRLTSDTKEGGWLREALNRFFGGNGP